MRNPWGNGEWKGKFSDGDKESWTQRLRAKLDLVDKDDGEFWIQFSDLIREFAQIYICRVLTLDKGWVKAQVFGSWEKGRTAGGCSNNHDTFGNNPQFFLTVTKEPMDCVIELVLEDSRGIPEEEGRNEFAIGISIFKNPMHIRGRRMQVTPYKHSAFSTSRYTRGVTNRDQGLILKHHDHFIHPHNRVINVLNLAGLPGVHRRHNKPRRVGDRTPHVQLGRGGSILPACIHPGPRRFSRARDSRGRGRGSGRHLGYSNTRVLTC